MIGSNKPVGSIAFPAALARMQGHVGRSGGHNGKGGHEARLQTGLMEAWSL